MSGRKLQRLSRLLLLQTCLTCTLAFVGIASGIASSWTPTQEPVELTTGEPAPFPGVLLAVEDYRALHAMAAGGGGQDETGEPVNPFERGWERCISMLDDTKQKLAVAEANRRNKMVDTLKDAAILGLSTWAASRKCEQ